MFDIRVVARNNHSLQLAVGVSTGGGLPRKVRGDRKGRRDEKFGPMYCTVLYSGVYTNMLMECLL